MSPSTRPPEKRCDARRLKFPQEVASPDDRVSATGFVVGHACLAWCAGSPGSGGWPASPRFRESDAMCLFPAGLHIVDRAGAVWQHPC